MRELLNLLLDRLRGPACTACGERVRDGRISLHWYVEHAGELR